MQQSSEAIMKFARHISTNVIQDNLINADIVSEAVGDVMAFTKEPLSDSAIAGILRSVDQCTADSSQVRTLYERRVSKLLEEGIEKGSPAVASNAFGSSPFFLSICCQETSKVISESIEFMAEHLHVYLPIYRDILTGNL